MTENDQGKQITGESMAGAAERITAMVRGAGTSVLALVSPAWRWAVSDAAELEEFTNWVKATGLPEKRVERVVTSELSRTGPLAVSAKIASARTHLLSGAPYDGTSSMFEAMVKSWRAKLPQQSEGDARATLISLFDSGIFTPEDSAAMRESDINDAD